MRGTADECRLGGGRPLDQPATNEGDEGDDAYRHYRMYHLTLAEVDSVKALIRWTFSCGHHAAFARLLGPPTRPAITRLARDLVHGWPIADDQARGSLPQRAEPLACVAAHQGTEGAHQASAGRAPGRGPGPMIKKKAPTCSPLSKKAGGCVMG
jgi:hypothetical protein